MKELDSEEKSILEIALTLYVKWVDDLVKQGATDDERYHAFCAVDSIIEKSGVNREEVFSASQSTE